jgi:hypothetical protein
MEFVDDRTDPQKTSHPFIVLGTDSFLSGWGKAKNGASYAGWACCFDDLNAVERWVRSRSDMKRVRVVSGDYQPKSTYCAHCHIYFVGEDHPARKG